MCENWGFARLAEHLRRISLEEMTDAEEIIDRVLFLEGVPRVDRPSGVAVGKKVGEMLRLHLEGERSALKILHDGIAVAEREGDQSTREFFATRLPEEEQHVDWLETQLSLMESVGEANYLAQQI
jgi:bacterioferritin